MPDRSLGRLLRAALIAAAQRFAFSATPRLDAELLLAHALGITRERLLLTLDDWSVPAAFDALVERRVEAHLQPHPAALCLHHGPVTFDQPALRGELRADLDGRVGRLPPQRRDMPPGGVNEPAALGGGQHERKAIVRGRRERAADRFDVIGQRIMPVSQHQFRIDLDTPRRRREARRRAVLAGDGVLLVAEGLREASSFGMTTQVLDTDAERRQLIVPAGLDVAAEEQLVHAELQR